MKKVLTILIVLELVFIWGNSLISRELSGEISDAIMEKMNKTAGAVGMKDDLFTVMRDSDGDGVPEETSYLIRKAAHVTEFAVLAALFWLRLEKKGWARALWAFALAALTGALDETLQIFTHRGSQLSDVGIDALGAVLGVGLCVLGFRLVEKKRAKKKAAAR